MCLLQNTAGQCALGGRWFHSHEVGSVSVDDGAERESALPRRRHVGDADVTVAVALLPAPLLQCLHFACHLQSAVYKRQTDAVFKMY